MKILLNFNNESLRRFLKSVGLLSPVASRRLLCLVSPHQDKFSLHLAWRISCAGHCNINIYLISTLQYQLIILVLGVHRPPALGSLLLEQVHRGHRPVSLQHLQVALLGGLGTAGELVEVQHDGAQEVVLGEGVRVPHLESQTWRDLGDAVVPAEEALLLGDHDLLLGGEVVEGEDEPPVEIPLPGQ